VKALLVWYRRGKRDLPWRRTKDPYPIWVSEVMLQQTTVKVALPYYESFLSRFDSIAALAAATEEQVLAAWSGLGYYHRARNLHKGARFLVERHGGAFPRSLEAALGIPGVGLYTASAVLSIAFGKPLPVVDGNVRRVLARFHDLRGKQWLREGPYYNLAEQLLDTSAPGDWNQALMELGATICRPRKPACPVCPLRRGCRARASGRQEELPVSRKKRPTVKVTVAAAVVERRGRLLLVRREKGRLMGGMWELPQTSLQSRGLPDLVEELQSRHGLALAPGALVASTRHTITFRRIRLEAYEARLLGRAPGDSDRHLWATPAEIASLPVSSMTHKVVRSLASHQKLLSFQ
jgi:A/G-specific adenine glycosylase